MPSRRRQIALLLTTFGATLTPTFAYGADGPYEPNDSFAQANGPLVGGKEYVAAKETDNDQDFFYFNTSGQRQLDISVTALGGCSNAIAEIELRDDENRQINSAFIGGSSSNDGVPRHILQTSPGPSQYVLASSALRTGCRYKIRIDPPDAVSNTAPGIVVSARETDEADDTQSVSINGNVVATVPGQTDRDVYLGAQPAGTRVALDSVNAGGRWSWNYTVTNFIGRTKTTILNEIQSGGDSDRPRAGVVRHVVVTPEAAVLESCGEAEGQIACFPYDGDGDGVPLPADCDDSDTAIRPGAFDVPDNGVDENCDGFSAVTPPAPQLTYVSTRVSLSRRGTRYRGKVRSSTRCRKGRRLVLRRVGNGTKSYGRATSRKSGYFSIRRSRRLRGKVYVIAVSRKQGTTVCRTGRSSKMRR